MKLTLSIHWKDWCWSWSSNTLATDAKNQLIGKDWCWERLKAEGVGDDRGWGGWMASLTWWTWVWASSGSWWWTGKLGVLQSMGLQKVGHNWVTELNWITHQCVCVYVCVCVITSSLFFICPWIFTLLQHIFWTLQIWLGARNYSN